MQSVQSDFFYSKRVLCWRSSLSSAPEWSFNWSLNSISTPPAPFWAICNFQDDEGSCCCLTAPWTHTKWVYFTQVLKDFLTWPPSPGSCSQICPSGGEKSPDIPPATHTHPKNKWKSNYSSQGGKKQIPGPNSAQPRHVMGTVKISAELSSL